METVFMITLPKSATVFISHAIAQTLGLQHSSDIVTQSFPINYLVVSRLKEHARGGSVCVSHMQASPINLANLAHDGIRSILVHVRDPRAALLSWCHFLERSENLARWVYVTAAIKAGEIDDRPLRDAYAKEIAAQYVSAPLEKKISYLIDIYFPLQLQWLSRWFHVAGTDDRFDIHFSTYEDFVDDPDLFFQNLWKNLALEVKPKLAFPESNTTTHFRSGRTDEWRSVFTDEQIERCKIPSELGTRFRWS